MNRLAQFTEKAQQAHRWVSMNPERVGLSTIQSYESDLDMFLNQIPEQHRDWCEAKYKSLFSAWLSSKSNCISSFITGPSNFPVKRAEKYNRYEASAHTKLIDWRNYIIKRLNRKEKLSLDAEYEETESKIADMKDLQELMKAANKICKSTKMDEETKTDNLLELGIEKSEIKKLIFGDRMNRIGYAAYLLQNNLQMIKHYEDKLVKLKQRIEARDEAPEKVKYDGYEILENIELDRFQIFFDGKPSDKARELLKANGFKWAPSNECWQTFLSSGKNKFDYRIKPQLSGLL